MSKTTHVTPAKTADTALPEAEDAPALPAPAAPAPQLHLDKPRVLTLRFGAHSYTWTFRRILCADWIRFFSAMTTEATYIGGDAVETFEVDTAFTELAASTVEAVDGYRFGAGSATSRWRELLPPGHLHAFGLSLRDVSPSRAVDDEAVELSERQTVRIDCTWTDAGPNPATPDARAVRFTGLTHTFDPPTLGQLRAYNRKRNTTRIKGDGRNGTTIYAVRQIAMIELYDELICSVDEAYRVAGKPLPSERSAIAREMDGCHKVAAIQVLMASPDGAAAAQ